MSKKLKSQGPSTRALLSVIYDSLFVCKIGVETRSGTNLCVLTGLAPKGKQMR